MRSFAHVSANGGWMCCTPHALRRAIPFGTIQINERRQPGPQWDGRVEGIHYEILWICPQVVKRGNGKYMEIPHWWLMSPLSLKPSWNMGFPIANFDYGRPESKNICLSFRVTVIDLVISGDDHSWSFLLSMSFPDLWCLMVQQNQYIFHWIEAQQLHHTHPELLSKALRKSMFLGLLWWVKQPERV